MTRDENLIKFAQMMAAMIEDAGKGLGEKYPWLLDVSEYRPLVDGDWVLAIDAIHERGDKRPLLALLISGRELSGLARFFLADLVDRQTFKRGGQTWPVFKMTGNRRHEARNYNLVEAIRKEAKRRGKRLAVKDAIEMAEDALNATEATGSNAKVANDHHRASSWVQDFRRRVAERELNYYTRKPKRKR
jgi:hypothetical protein